MSTSDRLWVAFYSTPIPVELHVATDIPSSLGAATLQHTVSLDTLHPLQLPIVPHIAAHYHSRLTAVCASTNCAAVCGGRIESDYGHIQSPGYPDEYLSSQDCTWDIVVPSGYTVAIKFDLFRLENHEECIYDHLQVGPPLTTPD
jgi:hypothetical protein